jgi:hypothetical protein
MRQYSALIKINDSAKPAGHIFKRVVPLAKRAIAAGKVPAPGDIKTGDANKAGDLP